MEPCTISDLIALLEGAETRGEAGVVFVKVADRVSLVVTGLTIEDFTGRVVLETKAHETEA